MMICPATVFLGTCTDKALLSGGVLNYSTRLNLYVKGRIPVGGVPQTC